MSVINKSIAIRFICDNLPQDNEDWINALEDCGLYDSEVEDDFIENDIEYKIVSIYDILKGLGITKDEYKEAYPNANFIW